jgi:hypothetical protein
MQMGKLLKIKGSYGGRSQDRTVDLPSAVTQKRPMAVTKNPANGAGLPFAQL